MAVNAERLQEQNSGPSQMNQTSSADLLQDVNSILVVDCGSSFTRASLLELVDTSFSFVAHAMAPTTAEPPWTDVSVGARHAIQQIAANAARSLLDESGALIIPEMGGKGVDLFIVTCSAGQPLQVVLAGLVSQVSLASLERAASSAYVEVVDVIARDYVRSQDEPEDVPAIDGLMARMRPHEAPVTETTGALSDEDRIAIVRQHRPDAVWVAGGTDGGSHEPVCDLVETIALACTLVDGSPKPTIVYAGNAELRSTIVDLIGEEVKLDIIDNVRPTLHTENLATARATFQTDYVQRKAQRLPGMRELIGWSGAPVLSTAQAQSYLVMYLERLYDSGKGVLCADVGSANTVIATSFPAGANAEPDQGPNYQTLHVATNLGIGYGAPNLLESVGVNAVSRWLPFKPEPDEVERVLLGKGLRPTTIPQDQRELFIEQAAAREALRSVMVQARDSWQLASQDAPRWLTPLLEPIVASGGGLAHSSRSSQTVLMLLDAIEPVGITTLVLDKYGVASSLGAVAVSNPVAAVQALDAGAFIKLGTVIAPIGRARFGDLVLRVKAEFQSLGHLELDVKYGTIEVLPLPSGEQARIELRPRRGVYVGPDRGPLEVDGGVVGLIIDARGRPLRLPSDLESCHQRMQQWYWEMGV